MLTLLALPVLSQEINYSKIIPQGKLDTTDMAERLVQLAWNNHPSNRTPQHQLNLAQHEYQRQSFFWLNMFSVAGNLNEFTIEQTFGNPDPNIGTFLFPRYNVGFFMRLGDIPQGTRMKRIAKARVRIAEEEINIRKLELREEVLTRYEDYLMHRELLRIQVEVTEDESVKYQLAEQKFRNGQISIEDYNASLKSYNAELVKKIRQQRDFNVSRIALEQLIGVRLSEVR